MPRNKKAAEETPRKKPNKVTANSAAWKKQVLSERLRELMDKHNMTLQSTAKLMQERLQGESFNSVNLSHYRAGRSFPRPKVLKALSDVLGVLPDQLIPGLEADAWQHTPSDAGSAREPARSASLPAVVLDTIKKERAVPAFNIEDLEGGEAWLQINQRLSWPTVIKILDILKGESQS